MQMASRVRAVLTLAGLPRRWQIGIYGLAGLAVGLALVLARVANATSYLSDDPQACMNCHVMTDAYASWQRGSHGRVAVCTDCHVPHRGVLAKYAFKAEDGLKHSYVFTMRKEPQVLELSARAAPVVQANCVNCHQDQVSMILGQAGETGVGPRGGPRQEGRVPGTQDPPVRRCWDCHQGVHGKTRSLSASPAALRPGLPDAGLDWMKTRD